MQWSFCLILFDAEAVRPLLCIKQARYLPFVFSKSLAICCFVFEMFLEGFAVGLPLHLAWPYRTSTNHESWMLPNSFSRQHIYNPFWTNYLLEVFVGILLFANQSGNWTLPVSKIWVMSQSMQLPLQTNSNLTPTFGANHFLPRWIYCQDGKETFWGPNGPMTLFWKDKTQQCSWGGGMQVQCEREVNTWNCWWSTFVSWLFGNDSKSHVLVVKFGWCCYLRTSPSATCMKSCQNMICALLILAIQLTSKIHPGSSPTAVATHQLSQELVFINWILNTVCQ